MLVSAEAPAEVSHCCGEKAVGPGPLPGILLGCTCLGLSTAPLPSRRALVELLCRIKLVEVPHEATAQHPLRVSIALPDYPLVTAYHYHMRTYAPDCMCL